jgi:putative lipoprotein
MRYLGLLFFLLLSVSSGFAVDDKAQHFAISGVCGAGSETILHYKTEMGAIGRVSSATILGSLPGLVKEISDSRQEGNEFGGGDMAADMLGSFAGAMISNLLNDRIKVRLDMRNRDVAVAVLWRF